MNKIEYKIKVNGKSVTRDLSLIDLNWQDFCKATDLAISLENANGSQFSDISKLVQLHTGKSDQDMMEWKDSCNNQTEFINEIALVIQEISKHYESKKK